MIKILPLNDKSLNSLKGINFLDVYEGAVRSGKTVTSLIKFYGLILNTNEKTFIMSGNTIGSLSRNCLDGNFGLIEMSGGKIKKKVDSDGSRYLEIENKKVYIFGSDNKSSFKKIRGITAGGWYADEVNLHDREFIQNALQRTIASQSRFHIWTLNPESPSHWIYKDYINKYENNNIEGYKYYHYTLSDNPALSEDRKNQLKLEYTGLFYKRYILGLRCNAEGICYISFSNENIISSKYLEKIKIVKINIGVDIGGNKSATAGIANAIYFQNNKYHSVIIDELYDDKNKSAENIINNIVKFYDNIKNTYKIRPTIYIDSAEQILKRSIKNKNLYIKDSLKLPIKERIKFGDLLFKQKRIHILKSCNNLISALEASIWDNDKVDTRLDDGTINIDSIDAFEYSQENEYKAYLKRL